MKKKIYYLKVKGSKPGNALQMTFTNLKEAKNAFNVVRLLAQNVARNDIDYSLLTAKEV